MNILKNNGGQELVRIETDLQEAYKTEIENLEDGKFLEIELGPIKYLDDPDRELFGYIEMAKESTNFKILSIYGNDHEDFFSIDSYQTKAETILKDPYLVMVWGDLGWRLDFTRISIDDVRNFAEPLHYMREDVMYRQTFDKNDDHFNEFKRKRNWHNLMLNFFIEETQKKIDEKKYRHKTLLHAIDKKYRI